MPHKHTVAGAPSRLHTLQWVTMRRADTFCQKEGERERKGGEKNRAGEVEGSRQFLVHPSISPTTPLPPPSLRLILPLLCYLGGYVKHTHTRTHTHTHSQTQTCTININNSIYNPCKSSHGPATRSLRGNCGLF